MNTLETRVYLTEKLTNKTKVQFFISYEKPAKTPRYAVTSESGLRQALDAKLAEADLLPTSYVMKPLKGCYAGNHENSFLVSFKTENISKIMALTDLFIELGKDLGQESILFHNDILENILYSCDTGKIIAIGKGFEFLHDDTFNNYSEFNGVKFALNLDFDKQVDV